MSVRVIARLDIKGDNVVRGIHLEGLRVVGQPEEMARRYAEQGIDEIVFIDTVASLYGRNSTLAVIERTAREVFVPLTVGGGVRSVRDVADMLSVGADKITVNSAAVRRPVLIEEIAKEFGSQCVVSQIEVKAGPDGGWAVLIENGREKTGLDAVAWAVRCADLGAGEILLTSIDRDGTRKGYDIELTRTIASAVPIPVVASGGAGNPGHLVDVCLHAGADAVALGTLLHFRHSTLREIKEALQMHSIPVRPTITRAS
jgi:cyclase